MTPNFSAISLKFGSSVGPLHVASAMSVDGMNANQKPEIMRNDIEYKIKHVHANYDNCHMLAHYSNW